MHEYMYILNKCIQLLKKEGISRGNAFSILQCVHLFAKVEARGVGSNTNKHSRGEKLN